MHFKITHYYSWMHLGYYLGGPSLTKKHRCSWEYLYFKADYIWPLYENTAWLLYYPLLSLGKRLHMQCRRGAFHSVLEAKERW